MPRTSSNLPRGLHPRNQMLTVRDIRICIPLPSVTNSNVAGPGVEPGLGDYEPPVLPYTTPRI